VARLPWLVGCFSSKLTNHYLYDLRSWRVVPAAARCAPFQSCAVFPRSARKNRTQKVGTCHAAAGEKRGVV